MISCTGIGAVRPNTVLLGYTAPEGGVLRTRQDYQRAEDAYKAIIASADADKALLFYSRCDRINPLAFCLGDVTIDVWWLDTVDNGILPILLCHLLSRHADFAKARVRIFSPYWQATGTLDEEDSVRQALQGLDSAAPVSSSAGVLNPEEHRERMLKFLRMSRIAVNDISLIKCDRHLDVKEAMSAAVREQLPSRTALIIADYPGNLDYKDPKKFAQTVAHCTSNLPPILFVRGSNSNAKHSHHLGAAVGGSANGRLPTSRISRTDQRSGVTDADSYDKSSSHSYTSFSMSDSSKASAAHSGATGAILI